MEIKFNCIVTGNQKEKIAEFTEWLDGDGWKHDYYAPLVSNGVFDHRELGDGWHGEIIRRPFTGLKDVNSSDIFIGDYFDTEYGLMEVYFINSKFILVWADNGTYFCDLHEAVANLSRCGNKFENPELLHNK